MNEVESRFQVHVDNHIPLLFGHAHQQTVTGDTGVVYQNINATEVLSLIHICVCEWRFQTV